MKPLSKGDPVKVRLHTGEVVEAVYDCPSTIRKAHKLRLNGNLLIAVKKPEYTWECRIIGNPCVLVPVGVSV